MGLSWQWKLALGAGASLLGIGCGIASTVLTNQGITEKWGSGRLGCEDILSQVDAKAEEVAKNAAYVREQAEGFAGSCKEI